MHRILAASPYRRPVPVVGRPISVSLGLPGMVYSDPLFPAAWITDMRNDDRPRNYRQDTVLTHFGRNPEAQSGAINPPVYHASTILSKNVAEWENRPDPKVHFGTVRYGISGTPTTFALE